MSYYPVQLDLRGRPCIVVGGGVIAEGKVTGLVEAGARVTVLSPVLTLGLRSRRDAGELLHCCRAYRPGDLAGSILVISATDDPVVNRAVWVEAMERGILVNVVDDPPHCSFILPSIHRRGDLTIAVSTSGRAPALAVRLRESFERQVGPEHARFLELAASIRTPLARRLPSFAERKALWYRLVDSDVLDLLRVGDDAGARDRFAEIMGVAPEAVP